VFGCGLILIDVENELLRIQLVILRVLGKAWIEAENNQTNEGLAGQ